MYPKNQYSELIKEKIKKLNLSKIRTFAYNPNPEILTGEIEILTNYSQRKKSLKLRKKMFEDKEDEQSIKEYERLEHYPSINYKEFKKYNEKYFKKFNNYPNEITILTYDALGLIYYAWKKNGQVKSVSDFFFKNKIKGKIGTFSFKDKKVSQELNIYKIEKNKFIKF